MIKQYDSIAELRADWLSGAQRPMGSDSDWYGYETKQQTKELSLSGDVSLVPQAEAMIESISTRIDVPRRRVESCVAGSWPSVPDALAGHPMFMRRMQIVNDEFAPIHIYADTSSSAGIQACDLHKRGCAILALVLELSKSRPVTLYQITTMGSGSSYGQNYGRERGEYNSPEYDDGEVILAARINTSPLDLATACYALTSQGFSRRLTYETTGNYGGNGHWPRRYNVFGKDLYAKYITETISPNPKTTLYVEAPHLQDPLILDPVKWLHEQIARFSKVTEEETYV